jgi:ABC-type amino acid transport substrate-binding protein
MKKIIIIMIMMSLGSFCFAEEPINKNLEIYIAPMKPCVIIEKNEKTGEWNASGFEIELLEEVGNRLLSKGVIDDWTFTPVKWSEIKDGIKTGKADIAMAGLTIRSDRMEWSSFSMPTLNSGLGIMVLKEEAGMFDGVILLYKALEGPVKMFGAFLLFFAFILWFAERDKDPDNDDGGINDKFFPGIFEAIYFCIVTCSTVGYGDFAPKKWITRSIVAVLIIVGLIAFGNFLSLVSVARLEGSMSAIQSPSDLKGKIVLTQKGTTSVDTVTSLGAKPVTTDDIDSACDGLLLGRGDAVVFDYPVLLNYVKENPTKVEMVGGMFDDQYYGFMLKKDSPLKADIDLELLKIYEDGTYKKINSKWF